MAAEHLAHLVPSSYDTVIARCVCGWVSAPCGVEPATLAAQGHFVRTERLDRRPQRKAS